MSIFHSEKSAKRKQECMEILRGFMGDIADLNYGVRLEEKREEIAHLLEKEMDLFTTKERYQIYGFMEGMFAKRFKKILIVRLSKETDPKCLELLRAISDIHSKDKKE